MWKILLILFCGSPRLFSYFFSPSLLPLLSPLYPPSNHGFSSRILVPLKFSSVVFNILLIVFIDTSFTNVYFFKP